MSVTFCVNHQHADRCTVVSWNTNSKEGASGLPQLKFMEESSRLRPPIKGLQGVGISASQRLPIESKSYWSREWKQIHEPEGRTRDTSKRSHSTDPLPRGPVWHGVSTHTHHETQVPLPLSLLLPPLFLSPPEHMSPITVLLSQHTIKAERQTLLLGPIHLRSLLCFIWRIPFQINVILAGD